MTYRQNPDRVAYESIFAYPRLHTPQQLAAACRQHPVVALYVGPDFAGRLDACAAVLAQGEDLLLLEGAPSPQRGAPRLGWSEQLENPPAQREALWVRCRQAIQRRGGADVLPWGSGSAQSAALLASEAFGALLDCCRAQYAHVVVTLPLPEKQSAPPAVCPYAEAAVVEAAALDRRRLEQQLLQLCEYDILVLGVAEAAALQPTNPVSI